MKSILDPSFKYTSAAGTDLKKTFARIRRELQKAATVRKEQKATVTPFQRKSN